MFVIAVSTMFGGSGVRGFVLDGEIGGDEREEVSEDDFVVRRCAEGKYPRSCVLNVASFHSINDSWVRFSLTLED